LLRGRGSEAEQDIVVLNTAALLLTAGKAESLREAAELARDGLVSGRAGKVLDAYVEASRA
jgi:anthranilate phosphoribosyltransferase